MRQFNKDKRVLSGGYYCITGLPAVGSSCLGKERQRREERVEGESGYTAMRGTGRCQSTAMRGYRGAPRCKSYEMIQGCPGYRS